NIFEADFFDNESQFWLQKRRFDWVVGNPPWLALNTAIERKDQKYAWKWISDKNNAKERPVGNNSLSEAFTWRAVDVLDSGGFVSLLVHATSLFNNASTHYRRKFFVEYSVRRITNFSNLAYILFARRSQIETALDESEDRPGAEAPGATIVYTKNENDQQKPPIIHYGPFVINQLHGRAEIAGGMKKPAWAITMYEDEVQSVDPLEAETGDMLTWKLALWGTYRDQTAIERLGHLFRLRITDLEQNRGWVLGEGSQLRTEYVPALGLDQEALAQKRRRTKSVPNLSNTKRLNVKSMRGGYFLTVAENGNTLQDIPENEYHIRVHGGEKGMEVAKAPHLYWSHRYAAYSDTNFVIPPRRIGLAALPGDAEYLRAICTYLNSSVACYLLFFHSGSWGVDRSRLSPAGCRRLPLPALSEEQITILAELHRNLSNAVAPKLEVSLFNQSQQAAPMTSVEVVRRIDSVIQSVLHIPDHLVVLAQDFMRVRYQLNKGKKSGIPAQSPSSADLGSYAKYLRDSLDAFAGTHHRVKVVKGSQFITCTVEITRSAEPFEPIVEASKNDVPEESKKLWEDLNQSFSQWVYIQRGLRIMDGKQFHIWKTPRLIDWTKTQALLDSDDIIAEVLNYDRGAQ
ncbi:MAG: hypothetical protein M3Y56_07005, partial [Armatimonadota bacterium]|nr:hypothetical protein [Armatimonadota bacterium]